MIGKEEGRGELFSGNFGKSSKRPSLRGRRRRQRDKEGRQEPKTRKIFSIHTFLLVWKDKNCISILVKFEYISYNPFQLNFFLSIKLWHIDIIISSSKFVHDGTFQGSFLGYFFECRFSLYTSSPTVFCPSGWTQSWLNSGAAAARHQILIDPETGGTLFSSHYRKLTDISIPNLYPV